jgi:hypothetical protein
LSSPKRASAIACARRIEGTTQRHASGPHPSRLAASRRAPQGDGREARAGSYFRHPGGGRAAALEGDGPVASGRTSSFPRCIRIRVLRSGLTQAIPLPSLKRREAKRRKARSPETAPAGAAPPPYPLPERRRYGGGSPSGAPPRFLPRKSMPWLSPGRVSWDVLCRALPGSAVPVQRGTSQTGHHAGRTDARTARERGYKPRPREPHSLRQSAVTGDAPS